MHFGKKYKWGLGNEVSGEETSGDQVTLWTSDFTVSLRSEKLEKS